MTADHSNQIRRVLTQAYSEHLNAFRLAVSRRFAADGAVGFVSDAAVRAAIGQAEEQVLRLLSEKVEAVRQISLERGAYSLLVEMTAIHISDLQRAVDEALRVATFVQQSPATSKFLEIRDNVFRILEAHRESFAGTKNTGGRPPEWDWADAEVFAVAQLRHQDLSTPIRQAHIVKKLADRFMDLRGDHPSDSQLQKRARKILKEKQWLNHVS